MLPHSVAGGGQNTQKVKKDSNVNKTIQNRKTFSGVEPLFRSCSACSARTLRFRALDNNKEMMHHELFTNLP